MFRTRVTRWVKVGAISIAALIAVLACFVVLPAGRPIIARAAIGTYLRTKGFRLAGISLSIGDGDVRAYGIDIVDARDRPVIRASALDVRYGAPDRLLGIWSVDIERPHLDVYRERDGSYELASLLGSGGSKGASAPIRATVRVHDGAVDLWNEYSPSPYGRHVEIDRIDASAGMDQGARSSGSLTAQLETGGSSRISADFSEDDVARIGSVHARVRSAALAPIVDLLVSSTAFVIERGTADADVTAYALGWDSGDAPAWHLSGAGEVHGGVLRVMPIEVPIAHLDGPLRFTDGVLAFPSLSGEGAGLPINASGAVRLFGGDGPSIALRASTSGRLEALRRWLAFTYALPLHGQASVIADVAGNPSKPDVALSLSTGRGLAYRSMPFEALDADAYYHDGHVIVRDARLGYAGATMFASGDIDLTVGAPAGSFEAAAQFPTANAPLLADVDARGTTRAFASFEGPLASIAGSGFASASGGPMRIDAAVGSTPQSRTFTARLADASGGDLLASGSIATPQDTPSTLTADLYAHRFSIRSSGRTIALPGLDTRKMRLPDGDATIDGRAIARGAVGDPAGGARLSVSDVDLQGRKLGSVDVEIAGENSRFNLRHLDADGPAARVGLSGVLAIGKPADATSRENAGIIAGSVDGDLGRIAQYVAAPLPMTGEVHARVSGAFAGSSWLAGVRSSGGRIRVGGIPIDGVDAITGASDGATRVYAARAVVAHGVIAGAGTLPGARPGRLYLTADGVDLASVQLPSMPVDTGSMTAFADVSGTLKRPIAQLSASLSNGSAFGETVGGDADISYRRGTLTADEVRIDLGDSRIDGGGSASGVTSTADIGRARLSVHASMPFGDLASLSSVAAPKQLPLTGLADGRATVSGSLDAPQVAGDVEIGTGTVRGVTFDDLRAAVRGEAGALALDGGSVRFGSSTIDVAGSLAPDSIRVRASSRALDLDDFNDFFEGADLMDGTGAMDVTLASDSGRLSAAGYVRLREASAATVPLGDVALELSPQPTGAHVRADAVGPIGNAHVVGDLSPGGHASAPLVDVTATLPRIDLAAAAPYAHLDGRGLAGIASIDAHASGPLDALHGTANFVADGAQIDGDRFAQLHGDAAFDPTGVEVPAIVAAIDGAAATASGSLRHNGQFVARFDVRADDLGKVARSQRLPLTATGSASLHASASGTLRRPVGTVVLSAAPGSVENVAYRSISMNAAYRDGVIRESGLVDLGPKRGTLATVAALPINFSAAGFGMTSRPVSLAMHARGLALGVLDPFMKGRATVGGLVDADVSAGGTVTRPRVYGELNLHDAIVSSPFETVPATNGHADIAFDQDGVTIKSAGATIGSGAMALHGFAHIVPATAMRPLPSLSYSAHMEMRDARIDVPRLGAGTVDADLSLNRSGDVPFLSGNVTLADTSIPFANIMALTNSSGATSPAQVGRHVPGLPALQPGHIIVYGGSIFGDDVHVVRPTPKPTIDPTVAAIGALPHKVDLGLQVVAAKNVGVTGMLNVTGTGSVNVAGSTHHPKLSGTLTAVRGRAGFFNTTFDLAEGALTFDPADGFLPSVDAEATTSTDEADITVDLSGRVDHLTTTFSSDPDMPNDAIIAALLHVPQINSALQSSQGQPQSNLGVSSNNIVQGALAGELLGSLNAGLEQFLNVGEVDFSIDAFGRPSFEVRNQVGPHVYSVYKTTFDVPPAQSFGIDYLIRRSVQIELAESQLTPGTNPVLAPPEATLEVNVQFH